MSRTPEGKVKKQVKALLDEYHAYYYMPVPSGYGKQSLDFIGCHVGEFFAIETKAPGNHPTPRQAATIKEMEDAHGAVFVIGEDVDELDEYTGMQELREWLRR